MMNGVRLVRLKMIAFRSFLDETVVEFPESGLVSITGTNQDSKGSSGAGKSNLNLAIAYALGFCHIPATALQAWKTETPMQVELTLRTPDGEEWTVGRGAKTYLKVQGQKPINSATTVNDRLEKLFKATPKMLSMLVYRPQKKPGLFLSMEDDKKKEFLTALLGLDKYEEQIDTASERATELKKRLDTEEGITAGKKATLDKWTTELGPRPVLDTLALEEKLSTLKLNLTSLQNAQQNARTKYDNAKSDSEKRISTFEATFKPGVEAAESAWTAYRRSKPTFVADRSELDKLEKDLAEVGKRITRQKADEDAKNNQRKIELKEVQAKIKVLHIQKSKLTELEAKIVENEGKVATLMESKCYVCHQPWSAELEIDRIRDEIAENKATCEEIRSNTSILSDYETHAESLTHIPANTTLEKLLQIEQNVKMKHALALQKLEKAEGEHDAKVAGEEVKLQRAYLDAQHVMTERVQGMRLRETETLAVLREALSERTSAVNAAEREVDTLQAQIDLAKARYQTAYTFWTGQKRQIDTLQTEYQEAESKTTAIRLDHAKEKDTVALLKGFLNSIFDEVLAEVAEEANGLLASIPNVAHCSIDFRSDTVNQKGALQRKIVPIVKVGDIETSIAYGCSGGMETAVELAVDLALSSVVQRRTQAAPQWLVLDEAFDGFDGVVKEACLEILQRYAHNKLVLVVTHAAEFKEIFSRSIAVEYSKGVSRVA